MGADNGEKFADLTLRHSQRRTIPEHDIRTEHRQPAFIAGYLLLTDIQFLR